MERQFVLRYNLSPNKNWIIEFDPSKEGYICFSFVCLFITCALGTCGVFGLFFILKRKLQTTNRKKDWKLLSFPLWWRTTSLDLPSFLCHSLGKERKRWRERTNSKHSQLPECTRAEQIWETPHPRGYN